jgi:hypothetical protein
MEAEALIIYRTFPEFAVAYVEEAKTPAERDERRAVIKEIASQTLARIEAHQAISAAPTP